MKDKLPFSNLFRWMASRNPQYSEKKQDRFTPGVLHNERFLQSKEDMIVWLGHSSFFIQLNGVRLLTDPVFYDLTPFLRRKYGLPCRVGELRNIRYILLSHGHRDHLDIPTLKKLRNYNPDAEILCPLGFIGMMKSIGFANIQEAAWWQQYKTEGIDIILLPAKHWNRRLLTDYNTTLWGSFAIRSDATSLYFAGDTGYGNHFKEISRSFPSFDVCLMPVGAYKPRYVMEWAHTSPEEAVMAFHTLKGKHFIPMHYGTYDLSDEPPSEPVRLLHQLRENGEINGCLNILKVGEEFILHHS
jgi:L-ascorbate metabolism protein UlaG (beta-lactamase superfamily)